MNAERLSLQEHGDKRGRLVAIEGERDLPFAIKRVYCIYGMVAGARRGCHAHRSLEQLLVCAHGSCSVLLDDGETRKEVSLGDPSQALYIGPGVWREIHACSKDAVVMVLASEHYDEADFIRDYDDFLRVVVGEKADG